jgi:hypothetical protein
LDSDGNQTADHLKEVVFNPDDPTKVLKNSSAHKHGYVMVVALTERSLVSGDKVAEVVDQVVVRAKKNAGVIFVVERTDERHRPSLESMLLRRERLKKHGLVGIGVAQRPVVTPHSGFSQAIIWRGRESKATERQRRSIVGTRAEYTVRKGLEEQANLLQKQAWRVVDDRAAKALIASSKMIPQDARKLAEGYGRVLEGPCGCRVFEALDGITYHLTDCGLEECALLPEVAESQKHYRLGDERLEIGCDCGGVVIQNVDLIQLGSTSVIIQLTRRCEHGCFYDVLGKHTIGREDLIYG